MFELLQDLLRDANHNNCGSNISTRHNNSMASLG